MITVNVKLLNGDLLSIQHDPSNGFQHFVRMIYDMSRIPFGCLVLIRDTENIWDTQNTQNIKDGDELFAFADTSRVRPVVEYGEDAWFRSKDEKDYERILVATLCIKFYSTKIYEYYGGAELLYDEEKNRFALVSCCRRIGMMKMYHSTEKTTWFSSPIECLLSIEDARFPQDEETFRSIQEQLVISRWGI